MKDLGRQDKQKMVKETQRLFWQRTELEYPHQFSQLEQLKAAREVLSHLEFFYLAFPPDNFINCQTRASILIKPTPPRHSDEEARRGHTAWLEGEGWVTCDGGSIVDFGWLGLRLLGDFQMFEPIFYQLEYKPPNHRPR